MSGWVVLADGAKPADLDADGLAGIAAIGVGLIPVGILAAVVIGIRRLLGME
jgi:hypothetical protein